MNSKNPIIKNLAQKESKALSGYLKLVKTRKLDTTQTASGITHNQNETPIRYHKEDSMVVW